MDRGCQQWRGDLELHGRPCLGPERSSTTPWGTRAGAQLLKYNDRYYLIGGSTANTSTNHNDVWRSDDLLNWTRILDNGPFTARESHQVVVFDGRMWLIGGFTYSGDQRHNDVWWRTPMA